MSNCTECGIDRRKYQLVHSELCAPCYRLKRQLELKKEGKSCAECSTKDTKKWYGSLCRNCWRRKNDNYDTLNKRLKNVLRSRISKIVSGVLKGGSAVKDLGCSIEKLKEHIESKFQPGMTWDNYGHSTWHIDHIKPLYKFDLTDSEQFKEACHYSNLQPLWVEDHLKKTMIDVYGKK